MILITGAGGFLGRHLIKELKNLKLLLWPTSSNRMRCADSRLYFLDLRDTDSIKKLPGDIDTVIHLAALVPKKGSVLSFEDYMETNALGAKRLIEEAAKRGCERFIYASTQMVIEKSFYLPVDEEHPLVPLSDYGLSKAIGERYCLHYGNSLHIAMIILRFARIYGYGQNPGFVLTNFIENAMNNAPLCVCGEGNSRRDLLYVKDAVRAIILSLSLKTSDVFNIGAGRSVSIKELAETIAAVFGRTPSCIKYKNGPDDPSEDYYMDINKAKSKLGFSADYSLERGLIDYRNELVAAIKGRCI